MPKHPFLTGLLIDVSKENRQFLSGRQQSQSAVCPKPPTNPILRALGIDQSTLLIVVEQAGKQASRKAGKQKGRQASETKTRIERGRASGIFLSDIALELKYYINLARSGVLGHSVHTHTQQA